MKNQLTALLSEAFSPIHLKVTDESALHQGHTDMDSPHESHFRIEIVSHSFREKSRLMRHRLVFQTIQVVFHQGVHALAVSAYTPEEYRLFLETPNPG